MRARYSTVLLAAALSAPSVGAGADESAWRDIEGRIQYAYYTADARGLAALEQAVAPEDSPDALRDYYGALLAWREELLAGQGVVVGGGRTPAQLTERCTARIERSLSARADFADALALRAACLDFNSYRAHKDLARALQVAPDNPRVLLLDGMGDYQLASGGGGGNKERALGKLRKASAAFEAERRDTERLPGWGAADAWYFLARDLFDHGDALGARDALERALVIAPDFVQARALLRKITAG
jgi:tetratricopeptide (TPR) repeat protein